MFENRVYLMHESKIKYHAILMISFVAAIHFFPYLQEAMVGWTTNVLAQKALPYVIAYVGAIYLLPELLCSLVRASGGE